MNLPKLLRCVVCSVAALLTLSTQATDIVWTNSAGGDWNTAANWSPNQVPDSADNAFITNSGTYTVTINSAATATVLQVGANSDTQTLSLSSGTLTLNGGSLIDTNCTFKLSSGTLTGSGDITITGTLNWSGGTMSGSGRTIIAAGTGTMNMISGSLRRLNRVLQNDGTVFWKAENFSMEGGTINNNGIFIANTSDTPICYGNGGINAFNNAGNFTKAGSDTVAFVVNGSGNGVPFNNSGTVEVQSGTLQCDAGFVQTGGQTRLNGGNFSSTATIQILGGTFNGTGSVSGNVASSGTVSPGSSPGLLTINGNYTQTASGVLNIELAGLEPGTSFDRLAVSGTASLAGTLNVSLTNGFYPPANTNFIFLTAASRAGTFDTFSFPSGDVGMTVNYSSTNASVQVVNVRPVPDPIADRAVNPGQAINFTATATDADVPSNSLTFSLANPPAGATITSGGSFQWRPTTAQANTMNLVRVVVMDDGVPILSATNSFAVTVNPLAPLLLTPINYANGEFRFQVDGSPGPDYVILASTNLTEWAGIATNFSPTVPFQFDDAVAGAFSNRAYRVRLEP